MITVNNYLNGQGQAANLCAIGGPQSRAVTIEPGPNPGGVAGGGLEFWNNIFDAGGRSCERIAIWEEYGGSLIDVFTQLMVFHNVFVQQVGDRDITGASITTLAYREANGTPSGAFFCDPGAAETVAPGQCLNPGWSPSTNGNYAMNYEGDPQFEGSDLAISERPGLLPWSDFHTLWSGLRLAGNRTAPGAPAEDYEGDPRPNPTTCDIGHDEN